MLDWDWWVNPDYHAIWAQRIRRLAKLRASPDHLTAARIHYATPEGIVDFVDHWGVTVDPRNAGSPIPVVMPFVLFPKQKDYIRWVVRHWLEHSDGVMVKSRDCGASWLAMATSVALCIFYRNVSVGFGSATELKVDRSGDPDCLFYKGRKFIEYLPVEFKGMWTLKANSAHMRLSFPDSDSSITGEAGDKIGRGGRKSLFFVDEFAHIERPKLVDANLLANTETRIEMSSVLGIDNTFAEHARGGVWDRFDFHYRYDPRKVDREGNLRPAFEAKRKKADPVIWASEFEADFLASKEGIVIPQAWVQAAIGAAQKLGLKVSGVRHGALDIADRGNDKCAYGATHGIELQFMESWSGSVTGDIYASVEKAFRLSDQCKVDYWSYDGDGMGSGVRGDARKIQEERQEHKPPYKQYPVMAFRGSGEVMDPDAITINTERTNGDFFENYKAQCWWALRQRFLLTFRAVTGVITEYNPADLISISPDLPERDKTCAELSQPVWVWSKAGKMMIDKTPDDVASPNNADCVMMLYGYRTPELLITAGLLESLAGDRRSEGYG